MKFWDVGLLPLITIDLEHKIGLRFWYSNEFDYFIMTMYLNSLTLVFQRALWQRYVWLPALWLWPSSFSLSLLICGGGLSQLQRKLCRCFPLIMRNSVQLNDETIRWQLDFPIQLLILFYHMIACISNGHFVI